METPISTKEAVAFELKAEGIDPASTTTRWQEVFEEGIDETDISNLDKFSFNEAPSRANEGLRKQKEYLDATTSKGKLLALASMPVKESALTVFKYCTHEQRLFLRENIAALAEEQETRIAELLQHELEAPPVAIYDEEGDLFEDEIDQKRIIAESVKQKCYEKILEAQMIGTPEYEILQRSKEIAEEEFLKYTNGSDYLLNEYRNEITKFLTSPPAHFVSNSPHNSSHIDKDAYIGYWSTYADLYQSEFITANDDPDVPTTDVADRAKDNMIVRLRKASSFLNTRGEIWAFAGSKYDIPSPYLGDLQTALIWSRMGDGAQKKLVAYLTSDDRRRTRSSYGIERLVGVSTDSAEHTRIKEALRNALQERGRISDAEDSSNSASQLDNQITGLTGKEARTRSIAEKAIDLQTHVGGGEYFNWLSSAPFEVIRLAHEAYSAGATADQVKQVAATYFIFGSVDRSYFDAIGQHTYAAQVITNCLALKNRLTPLGPNVAIEELPIIAEKLSAADQRGAADDFITQYKKYTGMEAFQKYPWLLRDRTEEIFPYERGDDPRPRDLQHEWYIRNASHIPDNWNLKRLTKIIDRRLELGIDGNLHDATYWLKMFDLPNEWRGKKTNNPHLELALLKRLKEYSAEELARLNLPKKAAAIDEMFASPDNAAFYKSILGIEGKCDKDTLDKTADLLPELHIDSSATLQPTLLVGQLKSIGATRKAYIENAQKWLETHSTTPRTTLQTAWSNREAAIQAGYSDSPSEIMRYVEDVSLRLEYEKMEQEGKLPSNITPEVFSSNEKWLRELTRCYGGRIALETFSKYHTSVNKNSLFPSCSGALKDGWTYEVLDKTDPRGFTIGYDTGCCMTIDGAAEECIWAGYQDRQYGFILFKDPRGNVSAQSVFYTNQTQSKGVMVLDNIEANEGRDMGNMIERYSDALTAYITHQKDANSEWKINEVHVGEGYTSVGLDDLPKCTSIKPPIEGVYTDAKKQRLLLKVNS